MGNAAVLSGSLVRTAAMTRLRPVPFPFRVTDRLGRRLRPGLAVTVVDGAHRGTTGEVVGWRAERGIEVLTTEDVPRVVAVPPEHLDVARGVPEEAVASYVQPLSEPRRCVIVHPVGAQDVALRHPADPGPFPHPADFVTSRRTARKVAARQWGEACLEAIAAVAVDRRPSVVHRYLDAPMLRRVLTESVLPSHVTRVVFVVSDQDPPHADDTVAFGRLLELWLHAGVPFRPVEEVVEPIVLGHDPHLFNTVAELVASKAAAITNGCDELLVVQAGGTPAMSFGTVLGLTWSAHGNRIRHVQVPDGAPVVEADLPGMAQRSGQLHSAGRLLARRDPAGALEALAAAGSVAGTALQLTELAASVIGRSPSEDLRRSVERTSVADIGPLGASVEGALAAVRHAARGGGLCVQQAAWVALAQYARRDRAGFLHAVAAVCAGIPGWWFERQGVDVDTAHRLPSWLTPSRGWEAFRSCPASVDPSTRHRVERPPAGEGGWELALELFACLSNTACTCGLRASTIAVADDDVSAAAALDAAAEWAKVRDSELCVTARQLAHMLVPPSLTDIEAAVGAGGESDVRTALGRLFGPFGELFAVDVVAELCDAAAAALGGVA